MCQSEPLVIWICANAGIGLTRPVRSYGGSRKAEAETVPLWTKVVLRCIATLNVILCAFGTYLLVSSVVRVIGRHSPDPTQPHFGLAYGLMTAINLIFLAAIVLVSLGLFRLRMSAVTAYWMLVAGLLVYGLANGGLWLASDPIGRSIAAASGIGNMGIAPFELFPMLGTKLTVPYVYPLLSMIALILARKRYLKTTPQSAAG